MALQSEIEVAEGELQATLLRLAKVEEEESRAREEMGVMREAADNLENELRAAKKESESKDGTILKLVRNCQANAKTVDDACNKYKEAEAKAEQLQES